MITPSHPNWEKAPKDATHWAPETEDYSAAWYLVREGEPLLCYSDDPGDDASQISLKEENIESDRDLSELIPRPPHTKNENDVDNW